VGLVKNELESALRSAAGHREHTRLAADSG